MTDSNIKHLELLGKQVSFVAVSKYGNTFLEGRVTNIVFSLNGCPQISLNDADFYSFSEVIDFKVLDSI